MKSMLCTRQLRKQDLIASYFQLCRSVRELLNIALLPGLEELLLLLLLFSLI